MFKWAGRIWRAALEAAPLRLWAMFLAGPVMLLCALWLVTIIKDPSWPETLRSKQLNFLGWALLSFILINAIIIVTLAAARVRGSGPAGVSFEIDADGKDDTHPKVTVEVKE